MGTFIVLNAYPLNGRDLDGKKIAVLTTDGRGFVWDYPSQTNLMIDQKLIPAISAINDQSIIDNPEAVKFPDNPDQLMKQEIGDDDDETISLRSKSERQKQLQEDRKYDRDEDNDEQSILIQKVREHIIRFERLLGKYLDPDLPTSRKLRKKYMEERQIFKEEGYKEFIETIELKIKALCTFENTYTMEQFDGVDADGNLREGHCRKLIEQAKKGDFHSAQEFVNSVMQIVIEEEYGVPRRRLVTKIR